MDNFKEKLREHLTNEFLQDILDADGLPAHGHVNDKVEHTDLLDTGDNGYHDDRYLYKENNTSFTPDADYEPATKKYVDDNKYDDNFYGDGAEGAQDLTGSINTNNTSNFGEGDADQKVFMANVASGFSVGDHVFIYQPRDGNSVGCWEINKIAALDTPSSNDMTMEWNLQNDYGEATMNAFIFKIPEYTRVKFGSGSSLSNIAFDPSSQDGGVVVFYASEGVYIESGIDIDMNAKGYRGGAGSSSGDGKQGEGTDGDNTTNSTAANGNGGGGGDSSAGLNNSHGGGGGNAIKGTDPVDSGATVGGKNVLDAEGDLYNGNGGLKIFFGGGGGGNQVDLEGNKRTGGTGGGIIIIITPFIWVAGTLSADGGDPGTGGGENAGAGAGGTICLFSEYIYGEDNVSVSGSTTGTNGGDGYIVKGYNRATLPQS